ncbi:MAG: T9SS type A sorting domain-containing protein [Bacteroidales bacterium]|nr:T9SS type A sorting domain-containing protein [Bacteroidales bacterium]
MNTKRKLLFYSVIFFTILFVGKNNSYSQTITVDYAVKADPPLLKKFAQYNAGCINPYSNYTRDIDKLNEVDAHSFRIDLSIGKSDGTFSNPEVVQGTPANITYNFTLLDDLVTKLNDRNVLPLWSWCYIPVPLQDAGDWKNLKESIANWRDLYKEIHKQYALHYKNAGLRIGFHEIYNEPDLFGVFLNQSDFNNYYFEMYKYGALGIKEGDSEAVVGGPAYAIGEWIPGSGAFLDYVVTNTLPLDFCSFHSYMDGTSWPGEMDGIADGLDSRGFKTADIFIDEYSWLNGDNGGSTSVGANSPFNFYAAAARTFETMNVILNRTDVTMIHWAQFMESTFGDDPYGMIRKDGHRKAAFNAFKIYADMPVERNSATITNGNIKGWASSDTHKVCLVFWNNATSTQSVSVKLNNISFPTGNFRLYRIDSTNASYFSGAHENLEVEESQTAISTSEFTWSGNIPKKGVIYIVVDDNSGVTDFNPNQHNNFVAKDIRTYHYYPVRKKTYYAEFDRKRWIAYLGMGTDNSSHAQTGVVAENLPDGIDVAFVNDGTMQTIDKNSLLGLRVDYRVEGAYTKGVLFHGGIYNPLRDAEMAWGTKLQANEVHQVDLSSFSILFADYAPASWDGRVIISFIMQNTGANRKAKVVVKKKQIPSNISAKNTSQNFNIKVYPNPSNNGIFSIKSENTNYKGNILISISDLTGRECYSEIIPANSLCTINTNGKLKSGAYLMTIKHESGKRIVKKVFITQ